MARTDENVVFCSFRMYLNNPQHLKVAKVLKKVEADRTVNNGLTKNQFILDAIEYYLDHYFMTEDSKIPVTRKELMELKQELREEMQAMLRMGWVQPYPPAFVQHTEYPAYRNIERVEESPDDTVMDLVSDWD